MEGLLNKTVTIKHHTNILWEATELTNPVEVDIWSADTYNDEFIIINGGWLMPIEEVNEIILGG